MGYKLTDASEILGKTIQFSVYVKTPIELKLEIYQYVNGSYQSQTVTIPASSDTTSSVQLLIDSDAEHLLFRINYRGTTLENGESFFTDNWCLEEV